MLIVDEAQSLPQDLLEEIRLLANVETNEEKLLSVIIAGQPELADRLNHESLRQLKQRVALRCQLRPLTLQETAGYIAGRIRAAGAVGAQVFTREAVSLIHEHAHGIPRTVSVIADNALLGGFAAGQRPGRQPARARGLPRLRPQGARRGGDRTVCRGSRRSPCAGGHAAVADWCATATQAPGDDADDGRSHDAAAAARLGRRPRRPNWLRAQEPAPAKRRRFSFFWN